MYVHVHGGESAKATAVWSRSACARYVCRYCSPAPWIAKVDFFSSCWSAFLVFRWINPNSAVRARVPLRRFSPPERQRYESPTAFLKDQLVYLRRIFPDAELPEPNETPSRQQRQIRSNRRHRRLRQVLWVGA